MRAHRIFPFIFAATLLVGVALPRAAEAKIILVNIGDEVFEAGPLPAELANQPQLRGWKAGYKCGVFGIFWAYFHAWGCEPVLYKDSSYDDSPQAVAAVEGLYTEADKDMSLWGKHGRWLFAGLFLGGLFMRGDDDWQDRLGPGRSPGPVGRGRLGIGAPRC